MRFLNWGLFLYLILMLGACEIKEDVDNLSDILESKLTSNHEIEQYLVQNEQFDEERYPQCIETLQDYTMNNSYVSLEQVEAASKLMDSSQHIQSNEDFLVDESYAIEQIMKLSTIKELINLGTDVKFMIEEDVIVNEMIGYSVQVYEYQLDHIATIGWYFLEYKSGDLYMMDILEGEYVKIG